MTVIVIVKAVVTVHVQRIQYVYNDAIVTMVNGAKLMEMVGHVDLNIVVEYTTPRTTRDKSASRHDYQ